MNIRLIIILLKGYSKKYLKDDNKYGFAIKINSKLLIEKVIIAYMINDYLKKNIFVGYDLVMHEQISNKLRFMVIYYLI